MSPKVAIDYDCIAEFCRRWKVAEFALFGSVLRDDFDPRRSDVDVLVEFQPDAQVGLIGLLTMQEELAKLFRRRVDLMTREGIKPRALQAIVDTAQVVYVAAA